MNGWKGQSYSDLELDREEILKKRAWWIKTKINRYEGKKGNRNEGLEGREGRYEKANDLGRQTMKEVMRWIQQELE